MSIPPDSLPEPFRSQVEAAALEFAQQVVGAFGQSITDVRERLVAGSPSKNAQPNASGKTLRPTQQRILRALRAKGAGMNADQLADTLGVTTREVVEAILPLIERKQIVRRGNANGTRYYLS